MSDEPLIKIDSESSHDKEKDSVTVENVGDSTDANLKTTETDMMFQYMANEDKMVDEEKREFFNKDDQENEASEDSSKKDDDLDSYLKSEKEEKPDKSFFNPFASFMGSNGKRDGDGDDNDSSEPQLSKQELMLKKLDMLRKLGELKQMGVKLSQNYNMDSSLELMTYEYELHKSIRAKKNGIQWLNSMLQGGAQGLEMLNEQYDPFSLKIQGFGEIMQAQEGDFYEVLGEIYEKYNQPGRNIAPEIKLLGLIGFSIGKLHMANKKAEEAITADEYMQNNPEVLAELRRRAVANRMKKQVNQGQTAMNKVMNQHHELARNKAQDMGVLMRKQQEYVMGQQAQNNFGNMANQLRQAEIHSNAPPIIKPRKIPPGMIQRRANMVPNSGMMPNNNAEQEALRQQQIIEHKKALQRQELMKMQQNAPLGNINPNLGNILKKEINSDNDSVITSMTTVDSDDVSADSKVILRRRRRKRKANIKVDP